MPVVTIDLYLKGRLVCEASAPRCKDKPAFKFKMVSTSMDWIRESSFSSRVSNVSLLNAPLQPLIPITFPSRTRVKSEDQTNPIEVKRDADDKILPMVQGNVRAKPLDAAKQIKEIETTIETLTKEYQEVSQAIFVLQQWSMINVASYDRPRVLQEKAALESNAQLIYQRVVTYRQQIQTLQVVAEEQKRQSEESREKKNSEEMRLFQEWLNTAIDGVNVNSGKSIGEYRSFLKAAKETAKRQKKVDDDIKASIRQAEQLAKKEKREADEAAANLAMEKWRLANPSGTDKQYTEFKRAETARINREKKFENDYQGWVRDPANNDKDREAYKQFLENVKKETAEASKTKAKKDKMKAELEQWNANLIQSGIEPIDVNEYDDFLKRKRTWIKRNPGSSDESYLNYYKMYSEQRNEWLQRNERGDYDAYLKELEVKQKQKSKWETDPKNKGRSYEEFLQQEILNQSNEKNAWISKFKEGMADEASFETWKNEQTIWNKDKNAAQGSKEYRLGKGLLRDAYNSVLVEFANDGKNFDEWIRDRSENRFWKARVMKKQIELLNKLIAKYTASSNNFDIPVLGRKRAQELELELFQINFPESSNADYQKYIEWTRVVEQEQQMKAEEAAKQGVSAQETPKQFHYMVTLYYKQLEDAYNDFIRKELVPSFDRWVQFEFEDFKSSDMWWKGSFKYLSGIVERVDFANRPEDQQQDYRKALKFLKGLKDESDARAQDADAKESEVKKAAAEAKRAEKVFARQNALKEKLRVMEEEKTRKEELKEAARAERLAKGLAKKAATVARKAKEQELRAVKQALRDREREEKKNKKLNELKNEISGKPLQLASQLLVLDEERERLQRLFDEMVVDDDHPILAPKKDPEQPLDKRKTGRLSSRRGVKIDGELDIVPATWPVAQMQLTDEQNAHLFMTEIDVWPDREESDSNDTSSVSSTDPLDVMQPPTEPPSIGVDASTASGSTTDTMQPMKVSGVPILDSATVFAADPLLFNRAYAKRLLAAHIESLKQMHKRSMYFNTKVEYINVAEAIHPDINITVEQLLPFFEHMARYRNTMLVAKKFTIQQEMQLTDSNSGSFTALSASLQAIENMNVKPQWVVDALRMLESDNGRMPGQLYARQPYFLPLRIFAPPRVGKSATALLAASLAKRMGMVTFYSVSPNKNTPIAELSTKLSRLGWGASDAAKDADRLRANKVNDEVANVQTEQQCLQMEYRYYPIEDIPGGSSAPGIQGRSKCFLDKNKIDMVMYSSDVVDDAMRVGAVLSELKLKPIVAFHIRDEAQSLAKELKNEVMTCHKTDVPPPVLLQYLRAYYSNIYSLNCNVTATHFPTLLEYDLYGFIGSIQQNIQAGLPMTATSSKISTYLGSSFLPKLVPALQPLRPSGYIGVEALVTWKNKSGEEITLQVGANHSGVDDNGLLRGTAVEQTENGSVQTIVYEEQTDKLKALKAEKLELESKKGKNTKQIAANSNKLKKINEDIATLEEIDGSLDALSVLASNASSKKPDDPDPDFSSDESEDEDGAKAMKDDLKEKRRRETAEQRAKREEAEKINKLRAAADAEAVKSHFLDFLDAKPKEVTKKDGVSTFKMVPTYIGALNAHVSDRGMSSILRMLGKEAHKRALTQNLGVEQGGVAFLLYTSTINRREDVFKDKINIVGDKGKPKDDKMDESREQQKDEERDIENLTKTELQQQLYERFDETGFTKSTTKKTLITLLRARIEEELDLSKKSKEQLKSICDKYKLPRSGNIQKLTERIEEYRARGYTKPGDFEEEDDKEELPELEKISGGGDGSYVPCNATLSKASNRMAALVAVYDPELNQSVPSDQEPYYQCFFANTADTAISAAYYGNGTDRKGKITKFAVLGYSMLAAGLTVQSVLDTGVDGVYNFCPGFVALATAQYAPRDTQLQIAGRSFVDLKDTDAPDDAKIQFLGVKGMVSTLMSYSGMEEVLANIKEMKMFEALKDSFNADFIVANDVGSLGVVGTRRVDFGSILGLTPELAKVKSDKVKKLKATFKDKREAREVAKEQALKEKKEETARLKEAATTSENLSPG